MSHTTLTELGERLEDLSAYDSNGVVVRLDLMGQPYTARVTRESVDGDQLNVKLYAGPDPVEDQLVQETTTGSPQHRAEDAETHASQFALNILSALWQRVREGEMLDELHVYGEE